MRDEADVRCESAVAFRSCRFSARPAVGNGSSLPRKAGVVLTLRANLVRACCQERKAYYPAMTTKQYSDLDREIIVLSAVWDLIGSMVHYAHFEKAHRLEEATLMFKSRECSLLFIISLADFLSLPRGGTFGLKHRPGADSLAKTYLVD